MRNRNKQLIIVLCILAVVIALVLGRLALLSVFPASPGQATGYTTKQAHTMPTASYPVPAVPHNLAPIASNQWYSNIYGQFPTEPLYTLPAAFQLAAEGLGVSLPDVHKTANTIFASYITDLRVGFADPLQNTLAHGAPFTVLHVTGSTLQLTCDVTCQVYLDNTQLLAPGISTTTQALSLVIRGHTYILSLNTAIPVQLSGNILTLHGAQRIYLAALPGRDSYTQFKADAATEILGTMATPEIHGTMLYTTYSLTTSGPAPLIALYPHQRDHLADALPALGSYATIRGTLTLVQARAFTTALPLQRPAADFSALRTVPPDLASALTTDIQNFITTGAPGSKDYFLGVWFGRGTDLLQLAHALGYHNQEQQLLKFMEPLFTQSMGYFRYDASKTSVIATFPEFGNENLNDHHFHYGYYIRTAAELVQLDPAYLGQVQTPLNQMVDDIGTYERVWYGLYLWSQVTHKPALETTALYLYTTEIASVKDYWFGLNGLYNGDYQHALASIVWGGKVDFATWFSPDPNAIYGIQLLPFTPGSAYLGQLPDIAPYFADLQAHGGGSSGYWGDLLLMWESYYHPNQALAQKDSVSAANMNSPRSLFLYTLYSHAP